MNFGRHRVKLPPVAFHTLIEASDLRTLLKQSGSIERGGLAVIDCRFDLMEREAGRIAYRAGHIPEARYADLESDLAAAVTASSGRHPLPAAAQFAATVARLGIGPNTQVIAYDALNGSFAARFWWLMRWLGYSTVAVLNGGYQAWLTAGGPTEVDAAPGTAAGGLAPRASLQATVDSVELVRSLAENTRLVVDARTAERYAGTVEPIDAKAGHIPGAVNHPFNSNLGADGRFLPAAELRRRWLERLAGRAPADVVMMCGSGVTACHNLLSLEVAGLPGAALYPGSWSEWIRDDNRPVAAGAAP